MVRKQSENALENVSVLKWWRSSWNALGVNNLESILEKALHSLEIFDTLAVGH